MLEDLSCLASERREEVRFTASVSADCRRVAVSVDVEGVGSLAFGGWKRLRRVDWAEGGRLGGLSLLVDEVVGCVDGAAVWGDFSFSEARMSSSSSGP